MWRKRTFCYGGIKRLSVSSPRNKYKIGKLFHHSGNQSMQYYNLRSIYSGKNAGDSGKNTRVL